MSGPTDFPQIQQVSSVSVQSITANTETIIATLPNINSRGSNYPINVQASAVFAVQAATTSVTMRLRLANLSGAIIGAAQIVAGAVAGQLTAADGSVGGQYLPALEVAGLVIVLTIQATAAGANWNVTYAQIQAQQ